MILVSELIYYATYLIDSEKLSVSYYHVQYPVSINSSRRRHLLLHSRLHCSLHNDPQAKICCRYYSMKHP